MGDAFPGRRLAAEPDRTLDDAVHLSYKFLRDEISALAMPGKIQLNVNHLLTERFMPKRTLAVKGHEMIHIRQFDAATPSLLSEEAQNEIDSGKIPDRAGYVALMSHHYGIPMARALLSDPLMFEPARVAEEVRLIRTDRAFRGDSDPGAAEHAYYINGVEFETRLHTVMACCMKLTGRPIQSVHELRACLLATGVEPPEAFRGRIESDTELLAAARSYFGVDDLGGLRATRRRLPGENTAQARVLNNATAHFSERQWEGLWEDVFPRAAAAVYGYYGVRSAGEIFGCPYGETENSLTAGILIGDRGIVEAVVQTIDDRDRASVINETRLPGSDRPIFEDIWRTCSEGMKESEYLYELAGVARIFLDTGAKLPADSPGLETGSGIDEVLGRIQSDPEPAGKRNEHHERLASLEDEAPSREALAAYRYAKDSYIAAGIMPASDPDGTEVVRGDLRHYELALLMLRSVSVRMHDPDIDIQTQQGVILSGVLTEFDRIRSPDPLRFPAIHEVGASLLRSAPPAVVGTVLDALAIDERSRRVSTARYFRLSLELPALSEPR